MDNYQTFVNTYTASQPLPPAPTIHSSITHNHKFKYDDPKIDCEMELNCKKLQ